MHLRLRKLVTLLLCGITAAGTAAQQQPDTMQLCNKVDAYLQAQAQLGQFSGTVLMARGDTIIINKGYGCANVERKVPNTPKTQFRIASITKSFTALGIMMLAHEGKLNVHDTLDRYLPQLTYGKQLTIHHLLTHTSGIVDYLSTKGVSSLVLARPDQCRDQYITSLSFDATIDLIKGKPLLYCPGEKYSYSNSNYLLLGKITEVISGMSHERFLQENILTPFGMTQSGFNYYENIAPADRTLSYYVYPEIVADYDRSGAGDGSIHATAEDLYTFSKNVALLPAALREQLLKPWAEDKEYKQTVGYGCFTATVCGHRCVNHFGGIDGFNSWLAWFPDDANLRIIVLSNVSGIISPFDQITRDLTSLAFTGQCPPATQSMKRSLLKTLSNWWVTRPLFTRLIRWNLES